MDNHQPPEVQESEPTEVLFRLLNASLQDREGQQGKQKASQVVFTEGRAMVLMEGITDRVLKLVRDCVTQHAEDDAQGRMSTFIISLYRAGATMSSEVQTLLMKITHGWQMTATDYKIFDRPWTVGVPEGTVRAFIHDRKMSRMYCEDSEWIHVLDGVEEAVEPIEFSTGVTFVRGKHMSDALDGLRMRAARAVPAFTTGHTASILRPLAIPQTEQVTSPEAACSYRLCRKVM